MSNISLISLFINGLTLALALAFLIIVLWFDVRKALIQSFALFLLTVTFWNGASLLSVITSLIDPKNDIVLLFFVLTDISFASASVALYIFVTALLGTHSRIFRLLAVISLSLVLLNNLVVLGNLFDATQTDARRNFSDISSLYFIVFDVVSFYLLLRLRRKLRSRGLLLGLMLFIGGQGFTFLNPELGIATIALVASAIGTLIISFSMVQRELISPLQERVSQVEAMHQISVSIVRRNRLNAVVEEVTREVVEWLEADAAAVYLVQGNRLVVASLYQLPSELVESHISIDEGIAGATIRDRESVLIENYARDWNGSEDFYLARETVGSLMCVPLMSNEDVLGVLLVIASRHGKLFEERDLALLEQLGDQVAVAISHSQLFKELTDAHGQLETVLSSTDNPIIALTRQMKIVFINPSGQDILKSVVGDTATSIIKGEASIPKALIPGDYRSILKKLKHEGQSIFEIDLNSRTYLCHMALLGALETQGWVIILNDITDLKELDRMKSEMVRMTSHDLKNPLQAAIANIELLREDISEKDEEAILSLNTIERQLDKMNRIISGILDLERIKVGNVRSEECNVIMLLEQVIEEVSDYALERSIHLYFESQDNKNSPIVILGDFHQLKRAIVNLAENSIKFTHIGGNVWLSVVRMSPDVIIRVKDDGVGIPENLHEKVFERFFRGQQENYEHVSGSGLGLSFVKSIVENHNGKIVLDSYGGFGTTFSLIFKEN